MKLQCHCGHVIHDSTDFLPYKGRLVADRDWEDFLESAEAPQRLARSHVRLCYQCTACGSLLVEDPQQRNHFCSFTPTDQPPVQVLQSSRGAAWRGPMGANWFDQSSSGWMFFAHDEALGGMHRSYDSWQQLESDYYALFEEMQSLGRVRHAFLRRNGESLHWWKHSD